MTPSPHNATRGADGVGTSSQPAPSIYDEMLRTANATRSAAMTARQVGLLLTALTLEEASDALIRRMMEQAND